MNNPKITTLETAVMMDEITGLLCKVSDACDCLKYADLTAPVHTINGIFGVIAYATTEAHNKLNAYKDEFINVCGFEYPLHSALNRQKDRRLQRE